jgi:hypothetical protein
MTEVEKKINKIDDILKVMDSTLEKYDSTIKILEENEESDFPELIRIKELRQKSLEQYNAITKMREDLIKGRVQ